MFIYLYVYVRVCLCWWRFVRWQPVCVCEGECATRYVLDKTTRGRQRGTCGARVWRFDFYVCTVCVCVSQDTPMLDPEPTEEEDCAFLLYIHHLSSLRSRRPSCKTWLSCCILPLFTQGSSHVNTPARHCPTWPCGCFCPWVMLSCPGANTGRLCQPSVSSLAVTAAVYPTRTQTMLNWKSYYTEHVLPDTITFCFLRELLVFAKCY